MVLPRQHQVRYRGMLGLVRIDRLQTYKPKWIPKGVSTYTVLIMLCAPIAMIRGDILSQRLYTREALSLSFTTTLQITCDRKRNRLMNANDWYVCIVYNNNLSRQHPQPTSWQRHAKDHTYTHLHTSAPFQYNLQINIPILSLESLSQTYAQRTQ